MHPDLVLEIFSLGLFLLPTSWDLGICEECGTSQFKLVNGILALS